MASATQYLQKKVLDHLLGIATWTAPVSVYVSLHTASPGETGSHASEVSTSATGYARQLLTGNMGATDLSTGISVNTGTISFGPALTDWGTITHIGLEDASSAGNMLMFEAPTEAKVINTGLVFQLVASQLGAQAE